MYVYHQQEIVLESADLLPAWRVRAVGNNTYEQGDYEINNQNTNNPEECLTSEKRLNCKQEATTDKDTVFAGCLHLHSASPEGYFYMRL